MSKGVIKNKLQWNRCLSAKEIDELYFRPFSAASKLLIAEAITPMEHK